MKSKVKLILVGCETKSLFSLLVEMLKGDTVKNFVNQEMCNRLMRWSCCTRGKGHIVKQFLEHEMSNRAMRGMLYIVK